jgi:hypothetical protein
MGHYDVSKTKLRCDGNHEWGEPFVSKNDTDVILEDGELFFEISWVIKKSCQKKYENNVPSAKSTCQLNRVVDRGCELLSLKNIEEI